MAKKLTQEELENDPLQNSYAKLQEFYENNRNSIVGGAVAVILAIGLSIGYYYYSSAQEQEAQELMAQAESYYLNAEYEKALTGSDEDFTVGFEQIISNYSGTDAANLATYYAAVSEYNLGNTQEAISYMDEFEVPDGILGVAPLSFKAVLQTEIGNHADAADLYVQAAEHDENESTTPYNYIEAAHAFDDAGNSEQAREYAQKVVDDYPNSNVTVKAEKLLGKLLASNG